MSWNYRVVRNQDGLRIFDVYYDKNGAAISTHEAPTFVTGETTDDLRNQIELMLDALDKPILEERDIEGGSRAGPLRKIFTLIALAVPPLLLIRWDSRHANAVPQWLMLAACALLAIALLIAKFSEEDEVSDTGRAIGNLGLFLMGLVGMGLGLLGYVMRHEQSLLALLPGWMAPVGALMAVIAVVRGMRD